MSYTRTTILIRTTRRADHLLPLTLNLLGIWLRIPSLGSMMFRTVAIPKGRAGGAGESDSISD